MGHAQLVMLFISLFFFVVIFYRPWQTLCIDCARQEMFEIRSALFDLCATGKWSFDAPEYRGIRLYIESTIRFAHRISWVRLVIYSLWRPIGEREEPTLRDLIDAIKDDELRPLVNAEMNKFVIATIELLLWRSLPLLIMSAFAAGFYYCVKPVQLVVRRIGWWVYASIQADARTIDTVEPLALRRAA